MTTISVSLEKELIEWIDQLIKEGVLSSRSEAIRGGLYTFIREKLGLETRDELRQYLEKQKKGNFQKGVEAIRSVRSEE